MSTLQNTPFYVEVDNTGFYNFYYNMVAEVNKDVEKVLKNQLGQLVETKAAIDYRNGRLSGGYRSNNHGPSQFGVMGSRNQATGEMEFITALDMQGITAKVNMNLAQEILERAKYYCPVDTGKLRDSGRIEVNDDGSCRIFFDCQYAWYVHEFSWKNHAYPTRDHFLTQAIYEVEKLHGFGWA